MNLVPEPRRLTRRTGRASLPPQTAAALPPDAATEAVRQKLSDLQLRSSVTSDARAGRVVIGSPGLAGFAAPREPEGYALRCDRQGVAVEGADADGLFWGLVTLEQLLEADRSVPCVEIRDWPAFPFRGHHDDISRKQVSKLEDFKRIVRLLSRYKLPYYTPYMEDMLYLKSYPDIGRGRGRLTPREVASLCAEGRRHNVTVFPTYTLIGHQENLLARPKYRKYAREVFQPPSSFDPSKKILRPFLKKVIADVCELFPDAPYFHAGFDETQGLEEQELIDHANWCAEQIAAHGKRMLMWVDMFKNHYGIEKIRQLDDSIIPVEWQYADPNEAADRYIEHGIRPLGLAGYNSWCAFLPDFRAGKRNLDRWVTTMKRLGGEGFASSQWGDNGYENARDLCWNLFAYNGEAAWSGKAQHPPQFERRFEATFYGRPLPPLQRVKTELAAERRFPARQVWRWFRLPASALVRIAGRDAKLPAKAEQELKLHDRMLREVAEAKKLADREANHLDHFTVAIERERLVARRLRLAGRAASGLSGKALTKAVDEHVAELRRVRDLYRRVWLRHNKKPNIEVSLAVYDEVADSLRRLAKPEPRIKRGYTPIDLADHYNAFVEGVAGVPLGVAEVGRAPFRFAGLQHTHVKVTAKQPLEIAFEPQRVVDLHLIYGVTTREKTEHDATRITLLRDGEPVMTETLRSISQLCEWWAPLGEHIWAGGGFQYVDQRRNQYALKPGPYYGLMHLSGFRTGGGVEADALRIEELTHDEFYLFALTLQNRKL